jgi:hypothetical protein
MGKEKIVKVFRDSAEREWEVVVGRESWGTVVAIFVQRGGREPPRETILDVSSWDDGNRLLLGLDEDGLRALLDKSVPKRMD